ncbi:MAG: hypothetical protein M3P40_00330 [Actinomycetota bacterium]|nr:hypothetical protein [Actinomycetota bacterium]
MSEIPKTEAEVVEGVLVPARSVQAHTVLRAPTAVRAAPRQAAALAATSFVAGAATAAFVAHKAPRLGGRRRSRRKGVVGEILSSNSFLVDVHLVRRS